MFVSDAATVAYGTAYLRITAYFYLFLGVNFVLNGIVRSAGAMFQVLILNIISFWVLRYPLVYLFAEWFGELGIAWGYAVSLVISSAIVTMYYLYGNWREAKIYTERAEDRACAPLQGRSAASSPTTVSQRLTSHLLTRPFAT